MSRYLVFAGIILLMPLLATMYACAPPPPPAPIPAPAPPKPIVTILEPKEAATVEHETLVKGSLFEILPDYKVWLIVVPPNRRFYPQWPPPTVFPVEDKFMWEGTAWIGQPSEVGMQSSIFAVVADAEADKIFRAYVQESTKTSHWPGLPYLPAGAKGYYDLITVTRAGGPASPL